MSEPSSGSSQKGEMTVIRNEHDELTSTRTIIGWRMRIDYRRFIKPPVMIISPFPSLIRCWKGWQGIPSSVIWMDILVSFRFLSIPMIRKRWHSHAPMVPLLIEGCLSDYAMPLPLSSDVWMWYFLIFLRTSWRCPWMISQSMDAPLTCVDNLTKVLHSCEEVNLVLN